MVLDSDLNVRQIGLSMYAMSQLNDHEAPSALKMFQYGESGIFLEYEMGRGNRLYQARSRGDFGFLHMLGATAILLGENSSMIPVIQPGQMR